MNPNDDPTLVCPCCAVRFTADQNGGTLQHCPTCGALLDVVTGEEYDA